LTEEKRLLQDKEKHSADSWQKEFIMSTVSYEENACQRVHLADLEEHLQTLLIQDADRLAKETGFVQRQSPITGAAFAQTLVFGFLNEPAASYTDLQQTLGLQGVQVTYQAIAKRMKPQAATFLQRLCESLVAMALCGEPTHLPVFERFNGIYLQDGTVIGLPDELEAQWPGAGGRTDKGGKAGLQVQLRLELTDGHVQGPWVAAARQSERAKTSPAQTTPLPKGALYITDAGLLTLPQMSERSEQGVFFLTAATLRPKYRDAQGRWWDLPALLAHRGVRVIDEPVVVGLREQVPCRLIAIPLPPAKSEKPSGQAARCKGSRHDVQVGRKKARKRKVRRLKSTGAKRRAVKDWLILLTNVPADRLSAEEARELMRARWQIELIWKLWKQWGQLDVWRSEKPMRILCEVWAKLIGLIIQHWLTIVGCWSDLHRSLVKASHLVKKVAPCILLTMQGPLTLSGLLERSCQTMRGCRLNPRRKRPNTSQRLLALSG
jgi:Transposase DDE domain